MYILSFLPFVLNFILAQIIVELDYQDNMGRDEKEKI